jgi:acyl-CoA-binding protein
MMFYKMLLIIALETSDTELYIRWKVWADLRGMSRLDAKQRYIELALQVQFLQ